MKRTNNIANLLNSCMLHILRELVHATSGILFHHYNRNRVLIYKLDKLEDSIYKIEWHLMFNIEK